MVLLHSVGIAKTYFEDTTFKVLPVCLNWKQEDVPTYLLVSCGQPSKQICHKLLIKKKLNK